MTDSEVDMNAAIHVQRIDIANQPNISLEGSFKGLKYVESSGLNELGKPKNQYTENYADSDNVRVYIPDDLHNDSRSVSITLLFIGGDRRLVYQMFTEYISAGTHRYTDSIRGISVDLLLTDAVEVSEDIFTGNIYYITTVFKFSTVSGIMMLNGSSDTIEIARYVLESNVTANGTCASDVSVGSFGMDSSNNMYKATYVNSVLKWIIDSATLKSGNMYVRVVSGSLTAYRYASGWSVLSGSNRSNLYYCKFGTMALYRFNSSGSSSNQCNATISSMLTCWSENYRFAGSILIKI